MEKIFTLLPAATLMLAASLTASAQDDAATPRTINIYDKTVFYDGYNDNVMDAGLDDGITRFRNSIYSRPLTQEELNWFGSDLTIDIAIGALCDNYDRIGNINLALVPKGAATYDRSTTTIIELCRFITPFMNKNKQPDVVPYTFDTDAVSYIFRDSKLREAYDFWVEFELFGVPYAANQQIAGCADRNDVFTGTLNFSSFSEPAPLTDDHVFVPVYFKTPEYIATNLNNYRETACDTIGVTTRTWEFTVPEDVVDSRVTLIISNHGANAGGEEYVRRLHLVYVDGEIVSTFTPGGVSCEPYRQYNTQPNGIYGTSRSDASWRKSSNWCPGAIIPIREIDLGNFKAGTHKIMIRVPKAKFRDKQGDFPVSIYFQGLTKGTLPAGLYTADALEPTAEITVNGDRVDWTCAVNVEEAILYNVSAQMLKVVPGAASTMSIGEYEPGLYVISLRCDDGSTVTRKIVRR